MIMYSSLSFRSGEVKFTCIETNLSYSKILKMGLTRVDQFFFWKYTRSSVTIVVKWPQNNVVTILAPQLNFLKTCKTNLQLEKFQKFSKNRIKSFCWKFFCKWNQYMYLFWSRMTIGGIFSSLFLFFRGFS